MKDFMINCLSSDGKISSKRLITLLAFCVMTLGFLCNMLFKLTIDTTIYDSMKIIVVCGLGFTASEQFGTKVIPTIDLPKSDTQTTDPKPEEPVK
jgi:hypothetical protein